MNSIQRGMLAVALVFGLAGSAAAVPTFSVTSPSPVYLGTTFEVDVVASDQSDLYAFQFDLLFDPTKFQLVSGAIEGPFLATAGSTFFFEGIPGAGTVEFVFDTLLGAGPGASGSGVLAKFNFMAVGVGVSTMSLANVLALDSNFADIGETLVAARVSVVPEPATLALLGFAIAGLGFSRRRL